ncbi:O-antigen ligase family protein [Aliarcobacter cryaerophilus]|uniref:O-antigen ligase family protein n=1 Tax=Aliarcobacter cryaerophilus TaxID=28198 RepID=UPI0013E0851A|nr:O-antigen ligase family protein [Aliarcobacter cryaerophilus]
MIRYAGLSLNANQLAIFFTVLPFIFLKKLLNKNINETEKYFYIILLSILIAYLTKSDALKISIIIGFIILIYLKFNTNLIRLSIYSIILLFFISCYLSFDTVVYIIDPETALSGGRFLLIKNAFYDLSNMIYFGFGPGPHSFIKSAFNGNYWEVHNTFIDWFTQTGILGLFLYFYLIYKIIKGLYIKKELILISAFSSLLIFSTFHFTFRQPIFWFFIFFFYIMSQGDKKCVE